MKATIKNAKIVDGRLKLHIDVDAPGAIDVKVFCPTGPGGGVDPTCSPHAKSEQVKFEINEREPGDAFTEDSFSSEGNLIRGSIGHLHVTANAYGVLAKISKKTVAALEDALNDFDIMADVKAAGIREIYVITAADGQKFGAPKNWTAAYSGSKLMIHTKTAEAIAKRGQEKAGGGMRGVIAHEAGHGVWHHAGNASKNEFVAAVKRNPEVAEYVSRIVNVAANPQAFSNTGSRLYTETFAEVSAMRRYAPEKYNAFPEEVRRPLETAHKEAADLAERFARVHTNR